ncbi:MAG: hypothetical protein R3C19_03345 [Planctomycetaceae bacterium]
MSASDTDSRFSSAGSGGRIGRFALLLTELVLIAAVVHLFRIEERRHLLPVLCASIAGFSIHSWLPVTQRLRFFALLSVSIVVLVPGIDGGVRTLVLGGCLIGTFYLPISRIQKGCVLAAATMVLALARVRFPMPFWPILGSMFMFRLLLFFVEQRNQSVRPSPASVVSYFFMLPNVCFPLFPVVDYRTFRDTYYDSDEWEIYQRGVRWIVRGMIHLVLYRFVKANLIPEPHELHDVRRIAVFMATNYALYLQVSGQFHLITGLLHLFGFNLPRTHHLYFLASSFSDIWRRINIYWKDFMTKVFFFPAFFAVRRRGWSVRAAIVVSVLCVFVATWLLHSWQTFWLRGRFPVTINDAFLWLGVGCCVAVNALFDAQRGVERNQSGWLAAVSVSWRTVGMFVLVSLFWACWTRPGFLSTIIEAADRPDFSNGLVVVALWLLAAVAVMTAVRVVGQRLWRFPSPWPALSFRDSARLHISGLAVVLVLASPWFSRLLSPEVARTLADFRTDAAAQESARGQLMSYYEDLNEAETQAGPLIRAFSPQDETRRAQARGFEQVSRATDEYQEVELVPGISTELDGAAFSVNQFGMRDRDSITLHKPVDTGRIAMVGSSIVMGYGVADDEVFTRVFEEELNSTGRFGSRRVEVLNFGVGRQWAIHRLVRVRRKVVAFEPDAMYYVAHQDEFNELTGHASRLIAAGRELPSGHLQHVAVNARVSSDMPAGAIQSRLLPFTTDLLAAAYRSIVEECGSRGIVPVWVYIPMPGSLAEDPGDQLTELAEDAGFVVCRLSDWTNGEDIDGLFRSTDEHHPIAKGHRLIAEALAKMAETIPAMLPDR